MQVLLIRHGRAEPRRPGRPDHERALTPKGRKILQAAARGLRVVAPRIDELAASPLVRAAETAQIIAAAYGAMDVSQQRELAPAQPVENVLKWLGRQGPARVVALVGHEPQLSTCISWLLSGLQESFVRLKKGSACLLEFDNQIAPGHAILRWSLTAGQLRRLGRSR